MSDRTFWVEILSRHGEVAARHRIDGDEVRIGRAYDNAIILDDPYVAAHHLRISRDPTGELIAEDLGSANGLFEADGKESARRIVVNGNRPIRIGTTRLRVRDTRHPVAEERQFAPRGWGWPVVSLLSLAVVALTLTSTWLAQIGEPRLPDYAVPAVAVCSIALAWAGMWAILGRIFSGNVRFRRNLFVAVTGLLVLMLLDELSEYAAFALSLRQLVTYRYVALWLALALFTYVHLRIIGATHQRLKASAVALIALIGIGMQTLTNIRDRATTDRQYFVRSLKPPVVRLVAPESAATFFAKAGELRKSLERGRLQQPPEGNEAANNSDED